MNSLKSVLFRFSFFFQTAVSAVGLRGLGVGLGAQGRRVGRGGLLSHWVPIRGITSNASLRIAILHNSLPLYLEKGCASIDPPSALRRCHETQTARQMCDQDPARTRRRRQVRKQRFSQPPFSSPAYCMSPFSPMSVPLGSGRP